MTQLSSIPPEQICEKGPAGGMGGGGVGRVGSGLAAWKYLPLVLHGKYISPNNVISVNLPMHVDHEYTCFMAYTHVCQELLAPKVRKRTFKFRQL